MNCGTDKEKDSTKDIDWLITVCQLGKKMCVYETVGYSLHGFNEVRVIGKKSDSAVIGNLINTFCRLQLEGEVFHDGLSHCIDNKNGEPEYVFDVGNAIIDDIEFTTLYPDYYKGRFAK